MNLTFWEINKLLRRRMSQLALLAALALTVVMAGTHIWFDAGYRVDPTTSYNGIEEFKRERDWAPQWRGPVTAEKLSAAREQYLRAFEPEYREGDGITTPWAWETYAHPTAELVELLREVTGKVGAVRTYEESIEEVRSITADDIGAFEENRTARLKDRLEQSYEEDEVRFFLQIDSKVSRPLVYNRYRYHYLFADSTGILTKIIGMMLCIAVAPLFAGEYQSGTAAVLLSTRHGRRRLARAKLLAALLTAGVGYLLCAGLYLALQIGFFGVEGLETSVQCIRPFCVAPLTLGQAELYALALGLLACLAAVAVTAALSARLSTPFAVIVVAFAVLVLLPTIDLFGPEINRLLALLPLVSNYNMLYGYGLYKIFGHLGWAPVVVLLAQPAYLLLLPLAGRIYCRHQIR